MIQSGGKDVWQTLRHVGIEEKLIQMIEITNLPESAIKVGSEMSEWLTMNIGTRQRFSMFANTFPRNSGVHTVVRLALKRIYAGVTSNGEYRNNRKFADDVTPLSENIQNVQIATY